MSMNEFINKRRKELNISLDELCERSGVPKGTVSKITAGINTNPKLGTLRAICDVLDCTLDDLILAEKTDISNERMALTPTEEIHINKYRALDERGRMVVDAVLNIEYNSCAPKSVNTPSNPESPNDLERIPLPLFDGTTVDILVEKELAEAARKRIEERFSNKDKENKA